MCICSPGRQPTGSSGFVYALAYGVNSGLLDRATFAPVAQRGWACLSRKALQPDGLFGYCQPVGGSPEHNINATSTSDFCVGLFLLAATEAANLRP